MAGTPSKSDVARWVGLEPTDSVAVAGTESRVSEPSRETETPSYSPNTQRWLDYERRERESIELLESAEAKAETPYGGVIKLPSRDRLERQLVVAAPGHWRGYENGAPWAWHNQYLVFTRDSIGWTYTEIRHPQNKLTPRAMAIHLLMREVVR